ncbi:hypothetical protein OIO03_20405, partial [Acinetobacter baumannii]|nr:hypothetical protein [Acinetobacter baumannii]MCW1765973.1 hypothetical protein [Acinetobacter baumannii]
MVAVAVVATIYTAGVLGTAAAGAGTGFGATFSATMSTGMSVLGGTAGLTSGTAFAFGAASGAVGSIASQVAGNAMGVQDGFSWKGVALSALAGGISSGLATNPLFKGADLDKVLLRSTVGNVLTQGVGVVTGLQSSFSWRGVAASAAGAVAGHVAGKLLGDVVDTASWDPWAKEMVTRTGAGLAAGTVASIAQGGRVSMQQVATDAFGNALGSSLASMSTGTELQAQTNKGLYSLGGSGDGGTGLRLGSGEGLRYSDMRSSSTWDDFGPSPVERMEASGPDVIAQAYEHMQAFPQTSARFQEVVDYYGSKAAYGNLPSLTPDATLVGFNSNAGEVWSSTANTFPVAEQSRVQPT